MQISDIRRQLIDRRRQILEQRQKTSTSWQTLQEPEVELEETAAKEKMARIFERLDDRERTEIEQIDHALAKLKASDFGRCESCGRRISEGRLKAIPWTPWCIRCAENRQSWKEKQMEGETGETDVWTSREFGTPLDPPDTLNPEKTRD